jgi:CRISPR-associated protein Csb2
MTLVLDIEHLLGMAFGARDQSSEVPDWPPQPDRVFSALVAAWGARGEQSEERRGLEWLEMQSAPEIIASGGHPRTAPIGFVPPNDADGGRAGNKAVMPSLRRRQPRRFPAFRPDDRTVQFVWREAAPDTETLAALNAVAADTSYVGHSASLTRCRFRDDEPACTAAAPARRGVYRGRLAELERDFHAEPLRRPRPGAPVRTMPPQEKSPLSGVFSEQWLVLEHVSGEMPDIRATALVARQLRNTVMSGYRQTGAGNAIPAVVSGHADDGRPTSQPHLAIAPLAFLGSPYASGTVIGFALIPPRGSDLLQDPVFRYAIRRILERDDRGSGLLKVGLSTGQLSLAVGGTGERRSLDPAPYVRDARVWATCTPIVLDRHLKATGNGARQQEIAGLIRQACSNAGLPEPTRIAADKHSAIEGAPAAYPSGMAPRWTRWRMLESMANRQLTHAVIEFPLEVPGPVILGAGRFCGLGLCLALAGGMK